MPTYNYRCPTGHEFEHFKKMADAGSPQECPTCGDPAPQVPSRIAPQWDRIERLGDPNLAYD